MNSESTLHTIAFYNTENLFDAFDDDRTNDNDFLPTSTKRWTKERYERKIYKLGSVIAKIGFDSSQKPPVLIGLAEVENDLVVRDLIQSKDLKDYNYDFVHYNSLDERGIDVALLYDKSHFIVDKSEIFPLYVENLPGVRDFTRDILLVSGLLDGEMVHILVNHWPSRHEGTDKTEYKRLEAASLISEIIGNLKKSEDDPKIIIMGDFNDNPNSKSILKLKSENELYNSMEALWSYSRGSVNHNFGWILFDQIFLTPNFLKENTNSFKFYKADIFDEKFLTQYNGRYKGQPYRTFSGKKYKGGFSDHFPVYIQIKK